MASRKNFLRILAVVVTLGLLVFLGASRTARPWREAMFGGIAAAIRVPGHAASRLFSWIGGGSRAEITRLEHERIQLLGEIANREALVRENETLKQALGLRQEGVQGVLPASVIGFIREGRDEYLIINRGAADGIGTGDVAVSRDQVFVGMVSDVTTHAAHVALLTSPSRSTDITFAGSTVHAIAKGNNDRELVVDLVPQQSDVKVGELVVAFPRATGLAKPLPVAQVREVKQAENEVFKSIRAMHLFDPRDDEVLVLIAP